MRTSRRASCAVAALTCLLLTFGAQGQEHDHDEQLTSQPPADRAAHADDAGHTSEQDHVAPDPPATQLHPMSGEAMAEMMGMDDTEPFWQVVVDSLEWSEVSGSSELAWEAYGWYGSDYHKLWVRTEGGRVEGGTEDARVEVLWDRVFSRWWSLQTGVTHEFGHGRGRDWLALGVQGLAPYFFEVQATAYVGKGGRTALRASAEYELLLTQRLILQSNAELTFFGQRDLERERGAGLSEFELGVRLRYEIRRELAPFVGVVWARHLGATADLLESVGGDSSELQWVAGLRFWF